MLVCFGVDVIFELLDANYTPLVPLSRGGVKREFSHKKNLLKRPFQVIIQVSLTLKHIYYFQAD